MPAMLGYSAPSQLFRQTYHAAGPARQHPGGARARARRRARAPFFRPLALAAALAALGAGPAHAMSDWQRECQRGTYEINPYTPCAQPFHEGLAAVMTGSEEDEVGRWGYIDKQGRMAIAPAFQEAAPFQNGLAAVRQDDLWGYIDAKGAWAIRPAYAEATGFNAQGTALVRIDERDVLIDRQGRTVKTLPLGARSWGFQPGQTLAEIEVPQPPRLFNVATGRALTLPDDVMALGEPTQGQIPAQRRASRYNGWWGLLDANGRWAVTPETLREEAPLRDGNVIAVRRDERWQFVDPQGRALSKQRYGDRVALLAPGAWLVKREHNAPAILLDADLRPMRSFRQDYAWPEKREGWTVLSDDEAILLVDPAGRLSILSLPQGRVDIQNGRAWVCPDLGRRRRCGGRRGDGRSGGRHPRRHRRLAGRRQHLARRAAVPAHGAQAQRQECRAGRGRRRGAGPPAREPDPAPRRRRRSIGCPILPPSRTRRRPWSSCPSPPRTCPRRGRPPCRSRRKPPMPRPWRWTRRRKQAMPWMPPSRKQQSRKRRQPPPRPRPTLPGLGQPPGDPDPDLRRRRPAAAEPHAGGACATTA